MFHRFSIWFEYTCYVLEVEDTQEHDKVAQCKLLAFNGHFQLVSQRLCTALIHHSIVLFALLRNVYMKDSIDQDKTLSQRKDLKELRYILTYFSIKVPVSYNSFYNMDGGLEVIWVHYHGRENRC